MLLMLVTATGLALAQQTDTTFAVQQGARLKVDNFGGEIVVRTWSEPRVRVRAEHSSRTTLGITVGPTVVSIKAEGRRGPPQLVDMQLTVPTWMALNLSGVYADIALDGVQATVSAETVRNCAVMWTSSTSGNRAAGIAGVRLRGCDVAGMSPSRLGEEPEKLPVS